MGIKIPAIGFYNVLCGLRDRLADQSIWVEPNVFSDVSALDLKDFRRALAKKEAGGRPLRVGYIYPQAETDLPAVTLLPESWSTAEAVLYEWGGTVSRTVGESADPETLTASAAGGELTFTFRHINVVPHSQTLTLNGDADALLEGVDYSINYEEGSLTLEEALTIGDTLTVAYSYFGSQNPRDVFGEISAQTLRLFVEANHPVTLMMLVGLIWRELVLNRATLEEEHGVKNLAMRVESLTDWVAVLPAIAFRQEFELTYMVTQTAEVDLGPQPTTFSVEVALAPVGEAPPVVGVGSGVVGDVIELEIGIPEGVAE